MQGEGSSMYAFHGLHQTSVICRSEVRRSIFKRTWKETTTDADVAFLLPPVVALLLVVAVVKETTTLSVEGSPARAAKSDR